MRLVIDGFYSSETQKPIVVDKSRGWPIPIIMSAMSQVLGEKPRIVATVRSIPDCMASFVRVAKPSNLTEFIEGGQLSTHLKAAYQTLQAGYQFDPSCFLFVEYDNLLSNPRKELERIHEFWDLDPFNYDFENIDGSSVKEDDENLHGFAGMHDVKPKLERQHNQSAKDVLGVHYAEFCQPEFWLSEPRTKPELTELDLQFTASLTGDFKEGRRLIRKLHHEQPNNSRVAFNRGWYALRDGDIQLGYKLMHQGRKIGVFGNSRPNTPMPEWNGDCNQTVLLYLEGGLGDQLHQARYANDLIKKHWCSVVICCSGPLVKLLNDSCLAGAVVQHGAEYGVYHDCWIPGMSAPMYLNMQMKDICGKPYLPSALPETKDRFTIGLRWSGNKEFENQHHKLFPPAPFFEAVKRDGIRYISLQRDADLEVKPDWVETVPLNTWDDTAKAVGMCDLVVSSCTSVSHLSAAMGVPTWVILPIMSYYLYVHDDKTTPYYDSMTLFKQKQYGDWKAPMDEIKTRLSAL